MADLVERKLLKAHVLLVEDDDRVASDVKRALASTCRVARVSTLAKARTVLSGLTFDAIVLDWRLDHDCGRALLDQLPHKDNLAVPPTIVTDGENADEALECGAAVVVRKPFKMGDLQTALASVLPQKLDQ